MDSKSISLTALRELRSHEKQPCQYDFEIYNSKKKQREQISLKSLNKSKQQDPIPLWPARFINCKRLTCLYDYNPYLNKQNVEQVISCPSCYNQNWRLKSILLKIKIDHQTYTYKLTYANRCIYVIATAGDKQNIHYYFEDQFTSYLHTDKMWNTNLNRLAEINVKNIEALFSKNIRRNLTAKESWETSNLESQCNEIIDKFKYDKRMEELNIKLNHPLTKGLDIATKVSLKYRGGLKEVKIEESQKVKIKNDILKEEFSQITNQNLVFYYCSSTFHLYVKNAKYFEDDSDQFSIRSFNLIDVEKANLKNVIWFKDRKGDIFSIGDRNISIYKFHKKLNGFMAISLFRSEKILQLDNQSSILYVPHQDKVYFFNIKNLKSSFSFQLIRERSQLIREKNQIESKDNKYMQNSCIAVTSFKLLESLPARSAISARSFYMMEDDKSKFKPPNPVIYLLLELRREGVTPIQLLKLNFLANDTIEMKDIQFNESTSDLTRKRYTKDCGMFFPLMSDNELKLCFQCITEEGKITLYEGKIIMLKEKYTITWCEAKVEINAMLEKVRSREKINKNLKLTTIPMKICTAYDEDTIPEDSIHINDIEGLSMNHSISFIGKYMAHPSIVQVYFTNQSGKYQWKIFNYYTP